MRGRVLLINPWIYDFAAYDLWAAPLGLLSIAAVLRDAGYQITYLDCLDRHHPDLPGRLGHEPRENAYGCGKFLKTLLPKPPILRDVPRRYGRYGLPLDLFDQELAQMPRPDVVMVTSGMTYWYPGAFEAIRRVKARFPGAPVILGGIYATLCHDHAVAHSGADVVVAGEGERQALHWASRLTGQEPPPEGRYAGLDDLPYPAFDLLRRLDYVSIATSRGCPLRCTYCASHLLHPRGLEQRSPQRVVDEIAHWHGRHGVQDIAFYDDALLVNADRHLHPILDGVLQRGLRLRFHTPNGLHARLIDRALADKMFAAGFKTLRLSLETTDPGRQRETGSKVTTPEMERAIAHLREAGFTGREIGVYILMGLPGQPLDEVIEGVHYVHRLGAVADLAFYSPIPGTVEWEHAVAAGHIPPDADPLLHNNTIYPILRGHASERECQQVKDLARALNRELAP